MFRGAGFKLSKRKLNGLEEFCTFGVGVYVKSWFLCRLPTSASANDLNLMNYLVALSSALAIGTLKKLCRKLWYLSEEAIALAFFDRDVDTSEKRLMIERLSSERDEDPPKRISVDQLDIAHAQLHNFVTSNTRNFFQILEVPLSFLDIDPDIWISNEYYLQAENIVHQLKIVNDIAERGVALMQEYNALLTKDEDQTQFALQVVQEHLKKYPDYKKSILLDALASSSSVQGQELELKSSK